MAAILVFQNNETAAMLVCQTNLAGVELFSIECLLVLVTFGVSIDLSRDSTFKEKGKTSFGIIMIYKRVKSWPLSRRVLTKVYPQIHFAM